MDFYGVFMGRLRFYRIYILMEKKNNKEINYVMFGNDKIIFLSFLGVFYVYLMLSLFVFFILVILFN